MRIIENPGGCASGQIYNIGNPANDLSVRELAELMLEIARELPEYRSGARQVDLIEVSSGDYYGKGYRTFRPGYPGSAIPERIWTGSPRSVSAMRCAASSMLTEMKWRRRGS